MVQPRRMASVGEQLRKKVAAHLANTYGLTFAAALEFVPSEIPQWGKLKQLNGGDMIHARDAVYQHGSTRFRDMTYVKVRLPPSPLKLPHQIILPSTIQIQAGLANGRERWANQQLAMVKLIPF